jgi:hypothetical protein
VEDEANVGSLVGVCGGVDVVAFLPFLRFRGLRLLGRRRLFWCLGWGARVRLCRVGLGRLMEMWLGSVQVAGASGSLALFLAVAYLSAELRLFGLDAGGNRVGGGLRRLGRRCGWWFCDFMSCRG